MKKIILSLLIGYAPWLHADSITRVMVGHASKTTISLSDSQRLEQLLNAPGLPGDVYWPAAIISPPAQDESAQQAKEQLLSDLKALQVLWMRAHQGGLVQATQQLLRELDQLDVAGRIDIKLDPDLSRVEPANNPRLSGDYSLYLSRRPSSLYLLGLINSRRSMPHEPAKGLAEYWQGHSLLPGANPGEVYLIQPDGRVQLSPVAVWNEYHIEPMPGATLFAGFDPALLPAQFKNINLRIADMIANRIPE